MAGAASFPAARRRVIGLTALAALAAVLLAVGLAAVQTDRRPPIPIEQIAPRDGRPPLALDLGVRTDTEAVALRRASALYAQGKLDDALAVFERHDSLEARVGKAFARWPERTVDRLVSLSGLHPSSALVQLHLGLALFWTKRPGEEEAWRAALSAEPDTSYAVTAENLLFQEFAPGIPIFFPSVALPEPARGLRADRQLAAFRQLAGEGDRAGTLYYGIALQRLGKRVSAQKVLGLYAREHPRDAEAQVAAAVARFLKGDPAAAFSRLGPLSRRFPDAATVRFHLGLLLLWSGEVKEARRQLRRAIAIEPGSPAAREAKRYLARLPAG